MRRVIVDYLPLLLALGLIAAWFGFNQPAPWSPQTEQAPAAIALAVPTPAAPRVIPRANAMLALCDANHPSFLGSLANLKSHLGARMGDAADCERPADADGNTQQLTTTGLAYYRRHLNMAVFTNGWEHWALVDNKSVHWSGNAVEPPPDAAPES